jgi:hypothetical protein
MTHAAVAAANPNLEIRFIGDSGYLAVLDKDSRRY